MYRIARPLLLLPALVAAQLSSPALSQTRPVQKAAAAKAVKAVKPAANLVPAAVVREADRYETELKAAVKPGKRPVPLIVANGLRLMSGPSANPRAAANEFREVVAIEPGNAPAWTQLSGFDSKDYSDFLD